MTITSKARVIYLKIKCHYIKKCVGRFEVDNKMGKMVEIPDLEEVLNIKQIYQVLTQALGSDVIWKLKWSEVKAIGDVAGYHGDHMKVCLHVEVEAKEKTVNLFVKRVTRENKLKAEFIEENHLYEREMLMYEVIEDICKDGHHPWCVKAYLYTDSIIVMEDLSLLGYSTRNNLDVLDSEHIFLTTTSIARFHAAFLNYEIKKTKALNKPQSTFQKYGHLMVDTDFCDSLFLRACSKLSANIIEEFSMKPYRNTPDLESKLTRLYLDACNSLKEYKNTVNVLLHKDLWVNNIMFKYENNVPVNAVLVDYQCLRYGPPVFDLMSFLYFTTDRRFRQEKEKEVFDHYYNTFVKNLSDESKKKIVYFGYDKEDFLSWCEKGRMLGMVGAIGLYPYILMDPKRGQKTFDDPDTYEKYLNEDRSEPVISYAAECKLYKERNLEITEEFVERYILKQV